MKRRRERNTITLTVSPKTIRQLQRHRREKGLPSRISPVALCEWALAVFAASIDCLD